VNPRRLNSGAPPLRPSGSAIGPEITVVVPTRLRETRLAFLLDALAAQTLAPERFEVIVVRADDAVDGPLTEPPDGLEVRFMTAPRGVSSQRNAGWRSAQAPLVAFTDDDCRPAPDWLERTIAAAGGETVFVQGRTEPDPDEGDLLRGVARTIEVTGFDVWAPTCNVAYPKALLERLGGFDERFVYAWGEDTDLALRARESGATQVYADDARVWHAVHPRTVAAAVREGLARNAIPAVVARHPQLRDALHFRVFLLMSHALLVLGFAGVLLGGRRRRWLGALAFVPYARHHLKGSGVSPLGALRWLLFSAPRSAAVDAAEVGSSAVASYRERTLVL
jgi:GT2 family glycosyltransferase